MTLELSALREGSVLATQRRSNIPEDEVVGNLALLSHFPDPPTPGSGVSFSHWSVAGEGVAQTPSRAFGPIMFVQYTVHRSTLKLTAQLAPIDAIPGIEVALETRAPGDRWVVTDTARIDPLSRTARFRAEDWDARRQHEYQVRLAVPLAGGDQLYDYTGTIAAEPAIAEPIKAAVFSCNADHGFPDNEVVRNVSAHEPDMALFLGDQFYEGSGGFGIQTDSVEEATLDMLHKWYMFGWSYRDLFRHIPAAFIPDDHDVYHGNVWGEGGKSAPTDAGWGAAAQDQGGYKMPAAKDSVKLA